MSEAGKYDGETCRGCEHWDTHNCWRDSHGTGYKPAESKRPSRAACEHFLPTETRRQTVAAEKAANALERIAVAMERVANCFCLAAEVRIGLARERVVDFGDGRCMQCNGTGVVGKGTTGEHACYDCAGTGRVG